ncbi:cysteine synthase CysK [Mycobacterium tuberculosis variant africanum]|nr:cysteine synthase CysK [Mycobacterium tuberculosis variant africanum]
MNNNLPLANPVNPTSITSNPQILLANRAHRTLVRSRQTRDRYRLLPEGYQVTPGRNRHPGTMVGNTRCFGYLSCRGPQTLTVDFGPS